MKKIILILILLLNLSNYCLAVTWGDTIIPDDKVMHWMAGWGQQALFESYGYTPAQARRWVFLTALAYECYQEATYSHIEWGDILAAMIGSYSWEIAEGVNFRLIIK